MRIADAFFFLFLSCLSALPLDSCFFKVYGLSFVSTSVEHVLQKLACNRVLFFFCLCTFCGIPLTVLFRHPCRNREV